MALLSAVSGVSIQEAAKTLSNQPVVRSAVLNALQKSD